jgi:hypothetical protein
MCWPYSASARETPLARNHVVIDDRLQLARHGVEYKIL